VGNTEQPGVTGTIGDGEPLRRGGPNRESNGSINQTPQDGTLQIVLQRITLTAGVQRMNATATEQASTTGVDNILKH